MKTCPITWQEVQGLEGKLKDRPHLMSLQLPEILRQLGILKKIAAGREGMAPDPLDMGRRGEQNPVHAELEAQALGLAIGDAISELPLKHSDQIRTVLWRVGRKGSQAKMEDGSGLYTLTRVE